LQFLLLLFQIFGRLNILCRSDASEMVSEMKFREVHLPVTEGAVDKSAWDLIEGMAASHNCVTKVALPKTSKPKR
jgi:hypothetical protein